MSTTTGPARVLTVCLGNICRSPTAEAALTEAAEAAGVHLEVASAGTGDWHVGQPPHPPMRAAATAAGLTVDGTAQQVDADLLAWADLVVVMDRSNLDAVTRLARTAGVDTPVVLFRTFDPHVAADAAPAALEVPDPYGGDDADYAHVVELCRRTAAGLVATWPGITGDAPAGAGAV